MYSIQLFKYGWIISKDGKELFCGYGSKEIAMAVAAIEGIVLFEIITDETRKAAWLMITIRYESAAKMMSLIVRLNQAETVKLSQKNNANRLLNIPDRVMLS